VLHFVATLLYSMRILATIAGAAWVASLATSLEPSSAQSQPPIRSGVELIEVDVVAVDAEGRPVTELRRDEFAVLENGRPRDVVSFSAVSLPTSSPSKPRHVDVRTNEGTADGRLIVLVLDDVNSQRSMTGPLRGAATELVQRLGPRDHVGLMFVSLDGKGARELTTNHAAVLQAIAGFEAAVATIQQRTGFRSIAPPSERPEGIIAGWDGPDNLGREANVLRPYRILADVSRLVGQLPHRRKALVYIGPELRPLGPKERRNDPRSVDADIELQRTLTSARRANVALYLLDPRSPLRPGPEELFEDNDALLARMRSRDLSALATATGGFASVSPLVGAQIDRVLSETGSYYLLGYYADPPDAATLARRLRGFFDPWESFRRIEVRTTRPGVALRARRGYWPGPAEAPANDIRPPGVSAAVFETMSGVLPLGDLPLRLTAVPFRGTSGEAHDVLLAVEVVGAAAAEDLTGGFEDDVAFAALAYEEGRRIRATDNVTAKVSLPAGRLPGAPGADYLLYSHLSLRPGQYQLRVGVRSGRSGKGGSVYCDLTVPDFGREGLSMSGIVIGRRPTSPQLVARVRPVPPHAPVLPSLVRQFTADEEVAAFVRVYRSARGSSPSAPVRAAITSLATDSLVWESTSPVTFAEGGDAEFRLDLPLADRAPGEYRLTISASSGGVTAARVLDFTVGRQ
jgi:VWFA-related protein